MGPGSNPDFDDFVKSLEANKVQYMLVGGFAVIYYGYNRTTGDMDIWVKPTMENYERLVNAFSTFGMPVFDMTKQNFLNNPALDVFTFGRSPICIDILTKVKGLEFDEAFQNSRKINWDNLSVQIIDIHDLLIAKKAASRFKDLDDIEHLGSKLNQEDPSNIQNNKPE